MPHPEPAGPRSDNGLVGDRSPYAVDLRDDFVASGLGGLEVPFGREALVGKLVAPFQLQLGVLERRLQIAQIRLLGVVVEFHEFLPGLDIASRFEMELAHDAGRLGRHLDAVHRGDRSDRPHVG